MTVGPPPPGLSDRRLRIPVVSPVLFRRLCIASLVAVCLIVLTGAAVRLTGSGLGCPDWPSCYQRQVTPQLSFHPVVEFSNRLVTVALTVLIAVTLPKMVQPGNPDWEDDGDWEDEPEVASP